MAQPYDITPKQVPFVETPYRRIRTQIMSMTFGAYPPFEPSAGAPAGPGGAACAEGGAGKGRVLG